MYNFKKDEIYNTDRMIPFSYLLPLKISAMPWKMNVRNYMMWMSYYLYNH